MNRKATTTYTIRSIKHTETYEGTLAEAIERARAIDTEYQPAFGVQVEDVSGATAWDSEDADISVDYLSRSQE